MLNHHLDSSKYMMEAQKCMMEAQIGDLGGGLQRYDTLLVCSADCAPYRVLEYHTTSSNKTNIHSSSQPIEVMGARHAYI